MGSKRAVPRACSISRQQWDKMLAAYRQRPTIRSVMDAGEIGKRIARRAILEGWPDASLPPFVELMSQGSTVHKEMAVLRESWEEAAVTQGEAARQAAEEAMAARVCMSAAMQSSKLSQKMAVELMRRLDSGEAPLPEELTPKIVLQVLKAIESSTMVLEKAMKIEQMQMGKPEGVLGVEIGMLLERCNESELAAVAESGELPMRILDQRKMVSAKVKDETDAEAVALEETEPGVFSVPDEALEGLDDGTTDTLDEGNDVDVAEAG